MASNNSRLAKIEVNDTNEETKVEIAGVFEGKFEGTYSVSLNVYDKAARERDRIVAFKTESGKVVKLGKGVFTNLIVYEDLDARPVREV